MKKLISLLMVLALLGTVSAFAAEIYPLEGTVVTGIPNGTFRAGFSAEDFEEDNCLFIHLYEEQRYDAAEVTQLAAGDRILVSDRWIDVESVEEEEGFILINGGVGHVNGMTLAPEEGGTYIATDTMFPIYAQIAVCSVLLADEVVFSHWQEDENGSIMEEPNVQTVASAELKDAMLASGDSEVYPENARLTIEGDAIVAVTVDYTP